MIPQTNSVFSAHQSSNTYRSNVLELRGRSQPARIVLFEQNSEWYESAKSRLEELVDSLPRGWDGYDGRSVSFSNAIFALSMLNSICRPNTPSPQIVPGSDGDLQVEWHTQEVDIELAVRGPYIVNAWRSVVGANPEGESLDLSQDFTKVAEWVAAISEPQLVANAAAA